MDLVVCADIGSTFTKTLLVSLDDAAVVAATEHRTTIDTDVLDGFAACRSELRRVAAGAADAPVRACSSAGGGLRVAVVGNEELVTAEAGRRVALSSGGRVVHVGDGGLDAGRLTPLRTAAPDVLLLVGGTDGGNTDVLLSAAAALAEAAWTGPVVLAGNAAAADEAGALLAAGRVPYEVADNVVPRIGVLAPDSARARIRAAFLRHVIGGKHLSASSAFVDMVVGPTPDVVLSAATVLGDLVGDIAVVDVGGATTDVYSVVELDPEDSSTGLARQVVAPTRVTRSVEGDLGVRWSASPTVEQGFAAGVVRPEEHVGLAAAADDLAASPELVPSTSAGSAVDHRLVEVATGVALRRHAGRRQVVLSRDGRVVERTGRDLREVGLLVGSGGVLRRADPDTAVRLLRTGTGTDVPGGWLLPRAPHLVVDREYVLAAVGLLASSNPQVAAALLRRHLLAG